MEMQKLNIKVIQEEDISWFINVAARNMLEEELKRPELVNYEAQATLARVMIRDSTGWIVKEGDEYVGALGSILVPNLFNPEYLTLAELVWYIDPYHRNRKASVLLLKAFEERAKEIADEATLSLLLDSPVKTETLERKGFMLEELGFRKVL